MIDLYSITPSRLFNARILLFLALAPLTTSLIAQQGTSATSRTLQQKKHAKQLLAQGRSSEAAAIFQALVATNPRDSESWYELAIAHDLAGHLTQEQAALQQALRIDPNSSPVHNQLGLLAMRQGAWNRAREEFETTLRLNPGYGDAENNLGLLFEQTGDIANAEQMFRRALTDDTSIKPILNLSELLAGQNRSTDALALLDRQKERFPHNNDLLSYHAILLARTGHAPEALEEFRAVVLQSPQWAQGHVHLGFALADAKHYDEALVEFTRATELEPANALAYYNRGRVLTDMDRKAEALAPLHRAVQLDATHVEWWATLANTAWLANNTALAVAARRQAASLEPKNAERLYDLGKALEQTGDKAAAIEVWKRSLDLDPNLQSSLYALSRALRASDAKSSNDMLARLQNIQEIANTADEAKTLANDALGAANRGDWQQAFSDMDAAIKRCGPCSIEAQLHKNLGLIYCQSGDRVKGEAALREALRLDPSNADAAKALQILHTESH